MSPQRESPFDRGSVHPFPLFLGGLVLDEVMGVYVCLIVQSCLTLCDPVDCSPPGSSVHGILQARILEWVAVPSLFRNQGSNPGIKPRSCTLQADSLLSEPPGRPNSSLLHSCMMCTPPLPQPGWLKMEMHVGDQPTPWSLCVCGGNWAAPG